MGTQRHWFLATLQLTGPTPPDIIETMALDAVGFECPLGFEFDARFDYNKYEIQEAGEVEVYVEIEIWQDEDWRTERV